MKKIAIVGAGLTGIVLARVLSQHATVTLFEKSRGVGGRMAARRADGFEFDHGAQYFTVQTELFHQFIQPMIHSGVVSRWDARFVELKANEVLSTRVWNESFPHYVGNSSMNNLCKYLASDLDVRLNTRIKMIAQDKHWRLIDESDHDLGVYDWVVVTAPAEQTSQLLPASFKFIEPIMAIKMLPCYTLMLGLTEKLNLNFDAAMIKDADISWISVNNSKPCRPPQPTLIVNSTNDWAEINIHADQRWIIEHLCQELKRAAGFDVHHATAKILQRWCYANVGEQTHHDGFIDADQQLAACGDWCIKGRVESAFLIGHRVAQQIVYHLN